MRNTLLAGAIAALALSCAASASPLDRLGKLFHRPVTAPAPITHVVKLTVAPSADRLETARAASLRQYEEDRRASLRRIISWCRQDGSTTGACAITTEEYIFAGVNQPRYGIDRRYIG